MHRRDCLKLIGAGALSFGAGSAALSSRRPNIVFVLTDDQGYGDIACHGNKVIKTPQMDLLHGYSARFILFPVTPTCPPPRPALIPDRPQFYHSPPLTP